MDKRAELELEVTESAASFIRRMMRYNVGVTSGFRLTVRRGGCSGMTVLFDLASEPAADDFTWHLQELRIYLDSQTCQLLDGAVLDFVEGRVHPGFVVTRPGEALQACAPASTMVPIASIVRT